MPFTPGCVPADLKDEVYECQGVVKTLTTNIPLQLQVVGDSLTWTWEQQWFMPYEEQGTYEFGIQYANGFLIRRIDSNKLSVKLNHINGTLFLDRCVLEFPVEHDTAKFLFKLTDLFPNFID